MKRASTEWQLSAAVSFGGGLGAWLGAHGGMFYTAIYAGLGALIGFCIWMFWCINNSEGQ